MTKSLTESALLDEKKNKLSGLTDILDSYLGPRGFEGILEDKKALNAPASEQIKVLSDALTPFSNLIGSASDGLGVGYYSKDLDSIISYSPSELYGYTVGMSVPEDHPGRVAMSNNTFLMQSGSMVRGNIMNAMRPIVRNSEVIGYIWANELTTDIEKTFQLTTRNILLIMVSCFSLALLLLFFLSSKTLRDVQTIKSGLKQLRFNLKKRIEVSGIELKELADSINIMANDLNEARTLSENIISSMEDGVITVDTNGKITAINPKAQSLTGLGEEACIDKNYHDVFVNDEVLGSLMQILITGLPENIRETQYKTNNNVAIISASTALLRNTEQESVGAILLIRDYTEKKHLEDQVHRADRLAALGELMAGVAHEIRNPLTSIKGFLQYFQDADTITARESYLPLILSEVDRMNRIIDALLYFARPYEVFVSSVDIGELLEDSLILVRTRSVNDKIVFTLNIDKGLPKVQLDREQFKQVFLNLLINSIQAMGGSGEIKVTAKLTSNKKYIEMCFIDTGPGIPNKIRENIFNPFFTTKQTGTGLGLSVVQRIIMAHGGKIEADESKDGGALIRLYLSV